MKLKSHSGMKKRIKIKKRKLMMQKSAKNHLLVNKSKRQKNVHKSGKVVSPANLKYVKLQLPYA